MDKIHWKSDERAVHILKKLMEHGYDAEAIADIMATSYFSVKGAAQKHTNGFRAAKYYAGVQQRTWSEENIQRLTRFIEDGLTLDEIAVKMNNTRSAIVSAVCKYTPGIRVIRYRAKSISQT